MATMATHDLHATISDVPEGTMVPPKQNFDDNTAVLDSSKANSLLTRLQTLIDKSFNSDFYDKSAATQKSRIQVISEIYNVLVEFRVEWLVGLGRTDAETNFYQHIFKQHSKVDTDIKKYQQGLYDIDAKLQALLMKVFSGARGSFNDMQFVSQMTTSEVIQLILTRYNLTTVALDAKVEKLFKKPEWWVATAAPTDVEGAQAYYDEAQALTTFYCMAGGTLPFEKFCENKLKKMHADCHSERSTLEAIIVKVKDETKSTKERTLEMLRFLSQSIKYIKQNQIDETLVDDDDVAELAMAAVHKKATPSESKTKKCYDCDATDHLKGDVKCPQFDADIHANKKQKMAAQQRTGKGAGYQQYGPIANRGWEPGSEGNKPWDVHAYPTENSECPFKAGFCHGNCPYWHPAGSRGQPTSGGRESFPGRGRGGRGGNRGRSANRGGRATGRGGGRSGRLAEIVAAAVAQAMAARKEDGNQINQEDGEEVIED